MPIATISASEALSQLRAEATARSKWPDHRTPTKRLDGLASVGCAPTFEIRPDDRIFTVGSCFARNIEFRLQEVGFETAMYNLDIRRALEDTGESLTFFNKYSAPVIRSELEWAAGLNRPPEDHILLPLPNGAVQDGFFNPRGKLGASLEEARARRGFVEGLFGRFAECRIFVMTLGLVEVWRDLKTGLRLNVTPSSLLVDVEPDRFVLDVLSYDEVLAELETIHAILARRGHPEVKILITVSPVPLNRTFRPIDVITANTYSKSVQRAAVEAFVLAHDNVDYFPSYETVTLTDRRLAFDRDNRHVQVGVVARVVDRFLRAYSPSLQFEDTDKPLVESSNEPRTAEDLLGAAKLQMESRQYVMAAQYFMRLIERFGDRHGFISQAQIRLRYGTCLAKAGMIELALPELRLAARAKDATAASLIKCVDRLVDCGDADGAAQALVRVEELGAPEPELQLRRARLHLARSQSATAIEILRNLIDQEEVEPKLRVQAETMLAELKKISRASAEAVS